MTEREYLHRFAMSCLAEDLRGHIPWGSARRSQNMELLLIHDSGESKVCNQQVRVVLWCSEQQILGLEIAVYNAVVMEVCNRGKCSPHQVGGIGFVVIPLAADAIEELTAECEVRYEVHWVTSVSAL